MCLEFFKYLHAFKWVEIINIVMEIGQPLKALMVAFLPRATFLKFVAGQAKH